jgi:hypothetical protein
VFAATEKTVETELKDSLFARFDPPPAKPSTDPRLGNVSSTQFSRLLERQNAPLLENRMPTSFIVYDEMQKWSPKFNRHTSLAPTVEPPEFDWSSIDPASIDASRDAIQKAFPEAHVIWFDGELTHQLTEQTPKPEIDPLVRSITTAPVGEKARLFNVLAQLSPTGAGNFEDLQILDSTDPDQFLLAIVMKQGDDLVVFRKLFRTGTVD